MGYELNRLMETLGVSSAFSPTYVGEEKPTKPAQSANAKAVENYNQQMAKYLADKRTFNQYQKDYQARMGQGSIYNQAQFQPYMPGQQLNPADFAQPQATKFTDQLALPKYGVMPEASAGFTAASAEGGIGEQKYLENIRDYLKTHTNDEAQQQFGASLYDLSRARNYLSPPAVSATPSATGSGTAGSGTAGSGAAGAGTFGQFPFINYQAIQDYISRNRVGMKEGGPVHMQDGGFMPNRYIMAPEEDLAAPASNADLLQQMLSQYTSDKYEKELEKQHARTQAATEAIQHKLESAMGSPEDIASSKAEQWFRLAAALGQPTKTGTIGETLGNVGEAMMQSAQSNRARRAAQAQLAIEADKLRLSSEKEQEETLRALAGRQDQLKQAILGKVIERQVEGRARTLTAEEAQAKGYPAGAVVQVLPSGKEEVVSKPEKPETAPEGIREFVMIHGRMPNNPGEYLAFRKEKSAEADKPITKDVLDPADPSRLITVDLRAYKPGTPGFNPETKMPNEGVIGIAGKEPSAAKRQEAIEQGQDLFDATIGSMQNGYDRLRDLGAIPSIKQTTAKNISASISASPMGRAYGKITGSEEQSIRDEINSSRILLLNAVKQATGMSATQLNSNVELQSYLKSLGDPDLTYEANSKILGNIKKWVESAKSKSSSKSMGGGELPPLSNFDNPSSP